MNKYNACVVTAQLCYSWLAIRLDLLGGAVCFFVVALTVLTTSFVSPGYLAIALSNAITLTTFLKMGVK